jgi:hypothetical protein
VPQIDPNRPENKANLPFLAPTATATHPPEASGAISFDEPVDEYTNSTTSDNACLLAFAFKKMLLFDEEEFNSTAR